MLATRALQALMLALYAPLSLLPRQNRSSILLRLGRRCTAMQRWLIDHFAYLAPIASAREQMSYEVLALATKLGIEYDPMIGHRGRGALDAALASETGVLVLGVHAKLNYLAVRYLDDRGMAPHVVATYTDRRIFGRRYIPRYIAIDTRTLLDVRQTLRQHSVVIALTDRGTTARHATGVDIEGTRIYLSNGLAAMAVATKARIVFMHPKLTGASVEFTWGEPPPDADINEVMRAFGTFLQEQAMRRSLAKGPAPTHPAPLDRSAL